MMEGEQGSGIRVQGPPVADLVAAAANVVMIIEAHGDLRLPLDIAKLRAGPNYQTLRAGVLEFQKANGADVPVQVERSVAA